MANVKITDLTAYTDPLNTDVLAIVDVTNNVTKKVSIANMAKNVSLGTAALPGVAFDGDPNTGIYSPGADELAISTNGTGRLFVDAAGLVGVGTSSPQGLLDCSNAGKGGIVSLDSTAYAAGVGGTIDLGGNYRGAGDFQPFVRIAAEKTNSTNNNFGYNMGFYVTTDGGTTFGTKALTIDSSGRLLVGTSSSFGERNWGGSGWVGVINVSRNGIDAVAQFNNWSSSAVLNAYGGAILSISRCKSGAVGTQAGGGLASEDAIGRINFNGSDGTDFYTAAAIDVVVDAATSGSEMPGRLVFSTTADGAASPTEAMRINSQQELLVGTATRNANGGVLQLKSGITFPATAVAASDANTLDDYEEGTWTPTISFGGSSVGVLYNSNAGNYTKIGNCVHINTRIQTSNNGSGTGQFIISGLPFVASGANFVLKCIPFTFDASVTGEVSPFISASTSTMTIYYGSNSYTGFTDAHWPNGGDTNITGFYFI